MNSYEHLKLPLYESDIPRQKPPFRGGGFSLPHNRDKSQFSKQAGQKAEDLTYKFASLKKNISIKIDPSLIFKIEINQNVSPDAFEKNLASMDIHVLSISENKKGFWVVFSEDKNLSKFKEKLSIYGSDEGPKYEFFHAIESFSEIPIDEKIGKHLAEQPLGDLADFIDLELWKITDPRKNELFIEQLKESYPDFSQFWITDTLITKSFVLLRVKLTNAIFKEIIQLKEVARADRPAMQQFNAFEMMRPNVNTIEFSPPPKNAVGILAIDSGIVSNHPMLEKCVGMEENFQSGETALQDTVGHGMGVAGCAIYGDIEDSLNQKKFTPSNWLFSAKVMYAEKNNFNGTVSAVYDPERLVEHQLKNAIDFFLSKTEYNIKVVNISLGNTNEIWHKHYFRQLPLAALIDELAYDFPDVVFIVSAGNQSPLDIYGSIDDIISNYPCYLIEDKSFKIINPASSALGITVGAIADKVKIEEERYGADRIKTPIAKEKCPSPFTRTGPGINGMIKPELVEYGGNMILSESAGRIVEDKGGKIPLLNNKTTGNIIQFASGTSFAAPKVAHLAGQISNYFPQKSANFIKNMLLVGADYPIVLPKNFYRKGKKEKNEQYHLFVNGYGLSQYERAIHSFDNRAVLWDEGKIGLNQIKIYSLQLPEVFFSREGKKKIIVTLTFSPETRITRGDSYLGNHMEFHLFHSVNPQTLTEKYGVLSEDDEEIGVPDDLKKSEIKFFPGANIRKVGCHQKAWKVYKREPECKPESPISLVLLNINKWIPDTRRLQDYCISVTFEHEKETELYNAIRANIQSRARAR